MNPDEITRALIPILGAVAVAVITLRPKKISPEQFMSQEISRLYTRMGELEESNRLLREEMQKLQSRMDASHYNLHLIKGYAFDLENHIHRTTGSRYERPDDVDAIFKDN